jgi:integrase
MKRRGKGEGSVYKRSNGTYAALVPVTQPNGIIKRVSITRKTEKLVLEEVRRLLEQENKQLPYIEKKWTVSEYLDYWLNNVQKNRVRETTMLLYSGTIEKYIIPTLGGHKIKNLSVQDVRYALDGLQESGCTPRTMQRYLQILSSCLSCAMREELIFRNVAQLVERPKYTPKETAIWSIEQAALFLQSIREHPQYITFVLLLIYGMRKGETLGLRWCDIDLDNGFIYVRQQIGRINGSIKAWDLKTTNSRRDLPLNERVRSALIEHARKSGITPQTMKTNKSTVVVSKVGTPLEPRNLARCFDNLCEKVGLPRIKIHAMHHTAATLMKDLDVHTKDVQLMLGHANPSTTTAIYQHGTASTQRTAISAAEDRLLGCKSVLYSL